MSHTVSQGKFRYRARSWVALMAISSAVLARRAVGRPLVSSWGIGFEIGVLFWRHQFNRAFAMGDMAKARAYFDSLQTYTDEVFDVTVTPHASPKGDWITPARIKSDAVILHYHGGGYGFYGAISRRFAQLLAHHLGMRVFVPDYRLTPEHPHPAQAEDALAAYRYMLGSGVAPGKLVLLGDSAGGHMVLMALQSAKAAGLAQPALAVGLCPWTDIGARGDSLYGNDRFDLVQGYMAVRFGEWLQGNSGASREALSPIHQDYRGLAPIYLQGGGREVLIDMIRDFARIKQAEGCDVQLEEWADMTHNFHAHGTSLRQSHEALDRIAEEIAARVRR